MTLIDGRLMQNDTPRLGFSFLQSSKDAAISGISTRVMFGLLLPATLAILFTGATLLGQGAKTTASHTLIQLNATPSAADESPALDAEASTKETGVSAFLVVIDRNLSLSEAQQARFRQLLQENWQDSWEPLVLRVNQEGLQLLRDPLATIPTKTLRTFLRPSQIAALSGLELPSVETLFRQTKSVPNKAEMALSYKRVAEQNAQAVANLKIEELQTLASLNTAQLATLGSAAENSVNRVVEERSMAYKKLIQRGPSGLSSDDVSRLSTPVSHQIDTCPEWNQAIDKTLSRSYRRKRQSRIAARAAFRERTNRRISEFARRTGLIRHNKPQSRMWRHRN